MTEPRYTGTDTDFYAASAEIAETVNLAIDLERPLLVEGEPGSGKTKLAYSIAAEKNLGMPIKIVVRSTSHARDLLYQVNSLRRFQEAQIPNNFDAGFTYPYISLGPLGEAIHEKQRRVVLIDEIDKADIDFPNDLLDVLDDFSFQIDDLPENEEQKCLDKNSFGKKIQSDKATRPIIVITSNREKRLPEPFLRRCLYVHLRLPDSAEQLTDIIVKNIQEDVEQLNSEIIKAAIESFKRIRLDTAGAAEKQPSTSELIDWIKILHLKGKTISEFNEKTGFPPFWKTLFKNINDIESYQKTVENRQQRESE
jgi:MoxR-like ATPase